jgi:putative ABC transport system permease protein
MHIPFTFLSLVHQKRRTAIAIAGVTFANVLIFMQLGFLGAAEKAATLLVGKLDYDIALASPEYLYINRPGDFFRSRLYQALAQPEVEQVMPFYIGINAWRIVQPNDPRLDGRRRSIQVVAFDLRDEPLRLAEVNQKATLLAHPGAVLVDTSTRDFFGQLTVGTRSELGLTQVEIVDQFKLGTGFGADGLLITSDRTFAEAFGKSLDRISLGLIKLRPGARGNVEAIAEQLRRDVAGSSADTRETLRVFTRAQLERHETNFWVNQTAVGKVFWMGVLVSLLVGVIFVYQVIGSDIKARLSEFATLKAIGYANGYLYWLIVEQALWYGFLGFIPALLLTLFLYEQVAAMAQLPIAMTLERAAFVLLLALGMCTFSGLLALRRVTKLDPADLF